MCKSLVKTVKWCLVQDQVGNQRHLVQQTVGCCCPGHASGGGLVWDHGQEDIQVVLKLVDMAL